MKTIWKYPFTVTDEIVLEMPAGAKLLTLQIQRGQPCIWALVDPLAKTEKRVFRIFGTGQPAAEAAKMKYLGTFQIYNGELVFHMFEAVP